MAILDRSFMIERGPVGVLLIHGLGGTPIEMRDVARALGAAGHTVLCCQLAGHGGNADDLTATGFEDWYGSVLEALTTLERSCDTVLVGGLSMGAVLAALLAARQPERVRGLIMLAPTLRYDGWSIPWYSFLLRLLIDTPIGRRYQFEEREPYGVKDERIRAIIVRALRQNTGEAGLTATPSQSLRELWRLVATLRPLLPTIRQRTLLIHARHDDIASLKNAIVLQTRLGGPVDCLILDDSYHLVTLDRQRHLVTERVVSFIGTLTTAIQLPTRQQRAARGAVAPPVAEASCHVA